MDKLLLSKPLLKLVRGLVAGVVHVAISGAWFGGIGDLVRELMRDIGSVMCAAYAVLLYPLRGRFSTAVPVMLALFVPFGALTSRPHSGVQDKIIDSVMLILLTAVFSWFGQPTKQQSKLEGPAS